MVLVLLCQASVEMMSPKSDAGLSSGPAIAGFGVFGQQASGPASTAGAVTAFGGTAPFSSSRGAMTFGSTDSRNASAFPGALHDWSLVPQ